MSRQSSAGRNDTPFFPVREAEVRMLQGCPALFVNGAPHTGLAYFFGRVSDSAEDIARFAEAGVHLFSGCVSVADMVREDGTYDFGEAWERFDYLVAANPRILILPRLGLDWGVPRGWWFERFPEEAQVDLDPWTREPGRPGLVSFSSSRWRAMMGEALSAFVRFAEERYGDHVIGYHLGAGDCGEWSYGWHPALSDYSAPQLAAYRAWLERRFCGDRSALARAWGVPGADFATAEIPMERTRAPGQPSIFDPARERPVIDYLVFHSEAVTDAILHFAGICKDTLRRLGRRKLCGVFHGYHFKNPNKPANYFNEGHFAQDRVLSSPDIDFICAPYDYTGREQGGMYAAQLAAGSVRLHGKLSWCEDDTFTFLSRREPHRSWCPDRASSIGVLRRNLAGVLRDGGTAWWMDCGGNGPPDPEGRQVHGWYRDEALMKNFAELQELAERRLEAPDRTPATQVAVVVSDASVARLRQDEALADPLVFRQLLELGALGASFDAYRSEDLELLFRQPWSCRYRLFVVLGALYLSPEERTAIDAGLKRAGRIVLWVYGPGLITDEAVSPAAMEELTGITVGLRWRDESLLVASSLTGTRVIYGTERLVSPVIYGCDPAAEVQGWFVTTGDPGLLSKQFDGWRSVWSGAPCVPAELLRFLARQAGVHLYIENGDQVISDRGLLALHAMSDGVRTIRLPGPSEVSDAVSGARIARGAREFDARLARGGTGLWVIEER